MGYGVSVRISFTSQHSGTVVLILLQNFGTLDNVSFCRGSPVFIWSLNVCYFTVYMTS